MAYTKENFEEWIILIDSKWSILQMYLQKENNLKLDYSNKSHWTRLKIGS